MAKAKILVLADDVVNVLNGKQWELQFAPAERLYAPSEKLEETDSIKVTVMPSGMTKNLDNRVEWTRDYAIDIGVQYRARPEHTERTARFDDCLRLTEQIADYYDQTRASVADMPLTAVEFGGPTGLPYFPQHITELHQFTGVVRLTFRE